MSSTFNTNIHLHMSNPNQTNNSTKNEVNISSNSTNNSNNNNDYNNLLTIRNRKLIELYCVSRLNELLHIKDENKFNSELNLFLNKNDINGNKRFQINTLLNQNQISLPNQSPISSPFNSNILPKGSLKNIRKKSISTTNIQTLKNNNNNDNNLINSTRNNRSKSVAVLTTSIMPNYKAKSVSPDNKNIKIPLNTINIGEIRTISNDSNLTNNKSFSTIVTPSNINNTSSNNPSNLELQTGTKRKGDSVTPNIDDHNQPIRKKNKVHFEDVSYTYKNIGPTISTDAINTTPINSKKTPLIRTTFYIDPNMKLPKTTPVSSNENIKTPLLKDLIEEKEQVIERTDGYLRNNINAKDYMYLLMKDNIPSKVAQTVPLAELRYMAQTLPLVNLIPKTHKALTTEIINSALNESRITVVSSRIEELRRLGLWSLRQPKKFIDPWNNKHTYYQILLDEAKWMQADFYEGKKYKIAVCTTIAQAIMDYWNYGKVCCIKTKPPKYLDNNNKNVNNGNNEVKILSANFLKPDEDTQNVTKSQIRPDKNNNLNDQENNNNEDSKTVFEKKISTSTDDLHNQTCFNKSDIGQSKVAEINNEIAIVNGSSNGERKIFIDRGSIFLENIASDINKMDEDATKLISSSKDDKKQEVSNNTKDAETKKDDLDTIVIKSNDNIHSLLETKSIDVSNLLEKPDLSHEINLPELPEYSAEEYEKILSERDVKPFNLYVSLSEVSSTEKNIINQVPIYMGIKKNDELKKHHNIPFAPISKSIVTLQDEEFYKLVERQFVEEEQSLVQLSKRRGMFYGNRRSHYLRPPPVPSLKYLQNRTPTIWLPEDDQELVRNINTYAYNWELISANMIHRSSKSYLSNIERRTPWQCFERFVQLNEKFNFNDLKGPRAHSAQQWLIEAHRFQQRQNRRISPLGVGNESVQRGHRRLRWASMFEVIRRCIKKRENVPRPNPTQPRKPMECRNMKIPTPAEMSQLKAQRDEALRRDIQLRRNAKNRVHQKQLQTAQNNNQHPNQSQNFADNSSQVQNVNGQSQISIQLSRGSSRNQSRSTDNNNNINSNPPGNIETNTNNKNIPVRQHVNNNSEARYTEEEIIELYARKIQLQKPNVSLETALQTARIYYKTLKNEQQQRLQQQLRQNLTQVKQRSNQTISQGPNDDEFLNNLPTHVNNEINNNASIKNAFENDNNNNSDDGNDNRGLNKMDTINNNLPLQTNKTIKSTIRSPTPGEILQKFQK